MRVETPEKETFTLGVVGLLNHFFTATCLVFRQGRICNVQLTT